MAILNFQKPDKVIMIDSTESHGKFEFRPLEPGYGLTIGNALRRVLLSSLEGYAFTSIKIDGVDHEFSTIKGVVEDVTEIILSIKQIRLKRQIDDVENEKINVIIGNQKVFKASDLQKFISGLGNIYANEILFLSGISPKRKVKKITDYEINKIIINIKKVLKASIKLGGSSIKNFSSDDGKKGDFQQYFMVYGRKGEKCSNVDCNESIIRIVISNRATFFCNKCQK